MLAVRQRNVVSIARLISSICSFVTCTFIVNTHHRHGTHRNAQIHLRHSIQQGWNICRDVVGKNTFDELTNINERIVQNLVHQNMIPSQFYPPCTWKMPGRKRAHELRYKRWIVNVNKGRTKMGTDNLKTIEIRKIFEEILRRSSSEVTRFCKRRKK